MKSLVPFDQPSATTIDDLAIETDQDSLVLSGSLQIMRDRKGLKNLERLFAIIQDSIASLQKCDLPDRAEGPLPEGPTIPNPFV